MSKHTAILTLHGMGKVKLGYYRDLFDNLTDGIGTNRWTQHVAFTPVQYQDLIQPNENRVWDQTRNMGFPLDQVKLRKFMLYSFADAAALEHSANRNTGLYVSVQRRIYESLAAQFDELAPESTKSVVVFAHSLGGQVISNYIWDAQHGNGIFADIG